MSSSHHWGAQPSDWDTLAFVAGVMGDLLPVVSNPGARIDPDSKLKTLGKVPSLYNSKGMVVGIADWTGKTTTARDVGRWSADTDLGICIQTRHVRALDIDIDDKVTIDRVLEIIGRHLGELPVRGRADTSRCLVAFITPGEFGKRVLRTEQGAIEMLSTGNQFVAVGTHPKGSRYEWEGGLPADFPEVSREAVEACWAELMAQFATEEVVEYSLGRSLKEARRRVDVEDELATFLEMDGWVLSDSRDGRLNIRCPFEQEHSGPSADDTATQYFPKGVGGFEQGHFHCLHAHCAGRNDGDFIQAVGFVTSQFEVVEPPVLEPGEVDTPQFARNIESGAILSNLANVVLALRSPKWLGAEVAHDDFRDELMIGRPGVNEWRPFRDADYTRLRLQLATKGLKTVGNELIKDAVVLVADENRFDSAQMWLSLKVPEWDGVPRIEKFFPTVFGTEDDAYHQAVGLYTWTALAGRIMEPGCKADMVPILRGDQGIGKSRAVAAMVPGYEFFVELDLSHHDDDMSRLMRGRMIAELGELKGLHSREIETIKAFITRRFENWVPKYREFAVTFPRRLLFMGTTNRHEFLADDTGNRRWLPMEVKRADADAVERDREQLWAEGLYRWRQGGVQFMAAEKLATGHHEKYRIHDSWEEVVHEWLTQFDPLDDPMGESKEAFRAKDVLINALGMDPKHIKRGDEMRLAGVLTVLGYERKNRVVNGTRAKMWVRKRD